MYLERDGRFVRTDVWREGEWLDLWSVVHFLSGMSVGLGLYYLGIGPLAAVALAFVSFIAYELWERVVEMQETFTNGVMDVVVGMASFLPTFFWLAPLPGRSELALVFAGVFIVNVLLSVLGWRASQKAAEFERRLRARFAAERARLKNSRARMRARRSGRNAPLA